MIGYRSLGMVQNYMGQQRQALDSLQQAERFRDPDRDNPLSIRFEVDPGLSALCFKIKQQRFAASSVKRRSQAPDAGRTSEPRTRRDDRNVHSVCQWWPDFMLGDLEAYERNSAELVAYCGEKKVELFASLASSIMLAPARRENPQWKISRCCVPRSMLGAGPVGA